MSSKITQQVLSQSITRYEALEVLEEMKMEAIKARYEDKDREEVGNNDIRGEFEEARAEIMKVPILIIMVPVGLPIKFVRQIGAKARKLIGEELFIDTKEDLSLVSGCALVWGGKMKDYSIREELEIKKAEIEKELREFVKADIRMASE